MLNYFPLNYHPGFAVQVDCPCSLGVVAFDPEISAAFVVPVRPVEAGLPAVAAFVDEAVGSPAVAGLVYFQVVVAVVEVLSVAEGAVAVDLVEDFAAGLADGQFLFAVVVCPGFVAAHVPCLYVFGCFFPGCSGLSGQLYLRIPVLLL